MHKSHWFILLLITVWISGLHAQEKGTLTGIVSDAETEKPLIGVNIILERTLLGTATNISGKFSIREIPAGSYTLTLSMMGYEKKSIGNVSIEPGETIHLQIAQKKTVIAMDPIIVTANKHPQSMSLAHQAITVVPHAVIQERQVRMVQESLNQVAGLHFNEENVSIRGSSGYSMFNVGSRILLMIDGVPYLTSDLGAINWELLPLLDIDHIEVVKGAGSALYGSSAVGGVINIITRQPTQRGRLQFRTIAGFYDNPYYKEWKWTDDLLHYERLDLSYGRQIGPIKFRMNMTRNVSTGYMENNALDQWNISGRAVWTLPNQSRLDVYASWMKSKRGAFLQWLNQNSPLEAPPFNKEDIIKYKTLSLYTQYHLPLSSRFMLKFRISNLISEMGNELAAYDPGKFDPAQGFGWDIQADWFLWKSHHLIFGNEFHWDNSGSEYYGNHKGYTISPYIQNEWTLLPNLLTTFGLRWDRHVHIDEKTDTRISPKAGINYKPFSNTTLRATLGSGFRAASVFEKYIQADYSGFNVIPNPDLKPERSWFWDVGFRQSISKFISMEASWFQSDYWDMIEPVVNFLGTIQFQNYVRARIRGVEFSGESWWWKERIGFSANLTWLDPRNLETGEILPYRPQWTVNLMGTLRYGPASIQAEYRFASRIENVELNPLDPRVPLKLVHLRGQVRWKWLTFQIAVNNALNYHYAQIERRMGEIRNFSFGILVDTGQQK